MGDLKRSGNDMPRQRFSHRLGWLISLLTAFVLTVLSFWVQSYRTGVVGNTCGPMENGACYGAVLQAGFPFAYVIDNPGVSAVGRLSDIFLIDQFLLWAFLLDILIYGILVYAAFLLLSCFFKPGEVDAEESTSPSRKGA